MLSKLRVLITLSLLIAANALVNAQDFSWPTNIGFYGGLNINMQSPSMRTPFIWYDNQSGSPLFTDTASLSSNSSDIFPTFGIIANFPINKSITFSGRIGYNAMRGSLTETVTGKTSTGADLTFTRELKPSISYLEISPIVQFHNLLDPKPLYFLAGLELGVPISAKFDYTNTLINGKISEEKIPDNSFRAALALGAGYVFKLSEKIYLTPEASLRLPLTKVSSNAWFDSWNITQIRLGANLTFALGDSKDEVTSTNPDATLNVGFSEVRYYDKKAKPHTLKKVTLEETQYTELFPIIPYVFFAEGSESPLPTYIYENKSRTGDFSLKNLPSDAMAINARTLDVIGARMKENKNAQLTLTGTLDMKSETSDALATKRAEFVQNYLVDNYDIAKSNITITGSKLPAKPSSSKDADGIQENRRVEIVSTSPEIIAPVLLDKDRQRVADPDLVEFLPFANSNEKIRNWTLEIYQAGRLVRHFEGVGTPSPIQWNISPNELEAGQAPLDYTFTAFTESGLKQNASGSAPVEYFSFSRKKTEDKPDKVISKFSLVVFDFDSPNVSDFDKNIIDKYVVPAIKFNSIVQIYGYTDRIGEENYNKKLATDRAASVKKYLETKIKTAKYETYGVGENDVLFDNTVPTGRQLSRTVQVYVLTPKQ